MPKKNFNFLSKILSCTSSWCNQPPPLPITRAQFLIPSLIGLIHCNRLLILYKTLAPGTLTIIRPSDVDNDFTYYK